MSRHVRRRPRRLRPSVAVRVVLAFGLVFGVGAAATDASWTDQEYATGTFVAGTLDIESSLTPAVTTSFSQHSTSAAAAVLPFNATAMYPGQTFATSWGVRAAAGSVASTGVLSEPTISIAPGSGFSSTNLGADLQYRVWWDTTNTACTYGSAPASGGWLAGGTGMTPGTSTIPITSAPTTTSVTFAAGANATTAGPTIYLCFQATLLATAANNDQGASAAVTWQMTASVGS